jgi:hypothetical protein
MFHQTRNQLFIQVNLARYAHSPERKGTDVQTFDVGGEISVKFRFNEVQVVRGEDARDEMEKKVREFFGPDAHIRIERSWFQPSVK